MGHVSTYLNFAGTTEEAFAAYGQIFGTTVTSLTRFSDMPDIPVTPEERSLVLNMAMPIHAGHVIMGSDMVPSMGHTLTIGNNTTIMLEVDSREQADAYFAALCEGGDERQRDGMADMFWGAYWGTCLDRFGVRWMINHTAH